MAISLSTLIADTRSLSTLRNSQTYTDDAIATFINDAAKELYDDLVAEYEHYNVSKFDFTLTSSQTGAVAPLPDDFYKSIFVLRNPTQATPQRVPMIDNFLNQPANGWGGGDGYTLGGVRYVISGSEIQVMPYSSAAGDYRLLYTPQLQDLSETVNPGYQRYQRTVAFSNTDSYSKPTYVIASANFSSLDLGGILSVSAQTPNTSLNGPFTISSVTSSTQINISSGPTFTPTPPIQGTVMIFDPSVSSLVTGTTRALSFASGGFDDSFIGATVTIVGANASENDGNWTVVSVPDEFHLLISDPDNDMLFEAAFPATATISIQKANTVPNLPANMAPWALYLKTHAAITIMTGRQQNTADLQAKLVGLKERVMKLAANRNEEPTRALVVNRGRRRFNGSGYY